LLHGLAATQSMLFIEAPRARRRRDAEVPSLPTCARHSFLVGLASRAEALRTIGGAQLVVGGPYHGYVDLIDLLAPTPILNGQVSIDSNSGTTGDGCVPLDLAVSSDHAEVVVRSADPYPDPNPSGGADLVRISLASPFPIVLSYGGNGILMGLDSLAAPAIGFVSVTKRIASISQDPTPVTNRGYVHIAH
jgi:hypothetical protein